MCVLGWVGESWVFESKRVTPPLHSLQCVPRANVASFRLDQPRHVCPDQNRAEVVGSMAAMKWSDTRFLMFHNYFQGSNSIVKINTTTRPRGKDTAIKIGWLGVRI